MKVNNVFEAASGARYLHPGSYPPLHFMYHNQLLYANKIIMTDKMSIYL